MSEYLMVSYTVFNGTGALVDVGVGAYSPAFQLRVARWLSSNYTVQVRRIEE